MERTGGQPHPGVGVVPSHESADWLRATIELAPIGIAHLALDGRILLANERLCTLIGYPREELLTRTLQGITYTDDMAICMARTAELAVGKSGGYSEEMRLVHADGSTVHCRVTMSAVPHGALTPEFLIAMIEQIPAKRAREDEEKISYQAKLLDFTHEAVIAFDAQERITFWNQGAERMYGWTADEVRGRTPRQVFQPFSTDAEKRQHTEHLEALRAGETATGEYLAQRKDASPFTVVFTACAFFDANGVFAGYVAIHRDAAHPRASETEKRDVRAHAEQAKQLRDEMLAVIAHDLRSPLGTIGLTEALMKILPPDEEPQQQLAVMQRSASSIEGLIRDLLDVTRIEAGTFAIRRARVLVEPLLQEVCDQFATAAREREITLICEMTRNVRAVQGDRERLAQVLSNLIANAIKFTPPQGAVSVRAKVRDKHVQISVEDTAPEVHPASLPHVFDHFFEADRTLSAGAGLGLQIAKGIVEAHGGCLWAENTLGRGTTFHFTVPARS